MKYILLSILIIPFLSVLILFSLSSPVFGGTSKYYSVGQCVSLLTINKDISGTNELNEFVEGLTMHLLEKITAYFDSIPSLQLDVESIYYKELILELNDDIKQ